MKRVSVVVPTYNEPALGVWLDRLERVLAPFSECRAGFSPPDTPDRGGGLQPPLHFDVEVVIVDDSTPALADDFANRAVAVRVLAGEKRGKGDAVRIGTLAATGEVVFHVDADVDEEKLALIPEFVRLAETHDVVIAERRSRWQYRNLGRFILSIGLFLAQRFFIFQSTRFFDTQCGFKAFRRDAARRLATLQSVRGGMYDIEYLYIAVKNDMSIAQVAISPMRELRPSRLRVWRCLVTDPVDLLRVKWNGLRGRYTR